MLLGIRLILTFVVLALSCIILFVVFDVGGEYRTLAKIFGLFSLFFVACAALSSLCLIWGA